MAADRNPSARRRRYFFSHASQWKLVGPLFTVLAIQFRRVWMHHPRLTNRKKSTANGRQTTTSNKNKPFTLREVKRQKQSLLLVSNVLLSVNYFDQAIFGWKGVSSHSFILANRGGQSGINSFVLTFNLHHGPWQMREGQGWMGSKINVSWWKIRRLQLPKCNSKDVQLVEEFQDIEGSQDPRNPTKQSRFQQRKLVLVGSTKGCRF